MSNLRIPPIGSVKGENSSFPDHSAHQLKEKLKILISEFERLINGMPDSHDELEAVANHVIEAGGYVQNYKQGKGDRPPEVIYHILNQPLTIPGATEATSLLQAAQNFHKEEAYESAFFKILSLFYEYPGPTKTLIKELKIISNELNLIK